LQILRLLNTCGFGPDQMKYMLKTSVLGMLVFQLGWTAGAENPCKQRDHPDSCVVEEGAFAPKQGRNLIQRPKSALSSNSLIEKKEPACLPKEPLDLVFLLDGSGSVGEEGFTLSKEYLKNVAAELHLGSTQVSTRMSIVQFDHTQELELPLSNGDGLNNVAAALDDMTLLGGGTATGDAIDYAVQHVFPSSQAGTAKILAILTDGKSQGGVPPGEAALRARDDGIEIIAVGVGLDQNSDALLDLTGRVPEKILALDDYNDLLAVVDETVRVVCENAVVVPTPKPTPVPTPKPTPVPTPKPTPPRRHYCCHPKWGCGYWTPKDKIRYGLTSCAS